MTYTRMIHFIRDYVIDGVNGYSHGKIFLAIELAITDMKRMIVVSGCRISSRDSDCFAWRTPIAA